MSTISEYIETVKLEQLAIPSNIKYGTAMERRGGVIVTKDSDEIVEAVVGGLDGGSLEGGGGKRKVQFWLDEGILKTHCNGNPKNHDIFCKHCVALLIYLQK